MLSIMICAAVSFFPPELDGWYQECSRGDWMAAEQEALVIMMTDTTSDQALAALVIARGLEGDLGSTDMEPLVSVSKPGSLERTALALALMQGSTSFMDDAGSQLQEALQLDPGNTIAWFLTGRLRLSRSQAEAESCFTAAVDLDASFLPARLELARISRDMGLTDSASASFMELWNTSTPVGDMAIAEYVLLSDTLGMLTKADSAGSLLEAGAPDAWERLAVDQAGSRPWIAQRAVLRGESSPSVPLGTVSLQLGDYSRAAGIFRELLSVPDADSATVLPLLGISLYMLEEDAEAREVFLQALESDPLSVVSMVHLGLISERAGETGSAVEWYLSALEMDTYEPTARQRLRSIADDSYDPEEIAGSSRGISISAGADLSVERGSRDLLEWGGSAAVSYRFDSRGTSVDGSFGGRSVTWEESNGLRTDTLNTNRGWASLGFDYWFSDSWYLQAVSSWDRQMYTERPWQISSNASVGWQKWIMSWFWFSPRLGMGAVNARWTTGRDDFYTDDFSIFAAAGLNYSKPHTFIRSAGLSGEIYFPPDSPENFISHGGISVSFRTWTPLYLAVAYEVDYTRSPEVSTWRKYNTSFTTSLNLDLY